MADSSFLSYLNLNEKNKRKSFEEATIMEILCSISEVIAFLEAWTEIDAFMLRLALPRSPRKRSRKKLYGSLYFMDEFYTPLALKTPASKPESYQKQFNCNEISYQSNICYNNMFLSTYNSKKKNTKTCTNKNTVFERWKTESCDVIYGQSDSKCTNSSDAIESSYDNEGDSPKQHVRVLSKKPREPSDHLKSIHINRPIEFCEDIQSDRIDAKIKPKRKRFLGCLSYRLRIPVDYIWEYSDSSSLDESLWSDSCDYSSKLSRINESARAASQSRRDKFTDTSSEESHYSFIFSTDNSDY